MVLYICEPLNLHHHNHFRIMSEKTDTIENTDPVSRFEDAMRELESVIAQMETGDLPLEKSLSLFERGVRLARECRKSLDTAELRVKTLLEQQGGNDGQITRPSDLSSGPTTD